MKSRFSATFALAALAGAFALSTATARADAGHARGPAVYIAHLAPMNAAVAGSKTTGEARLEIRGGNLVIDIKVRDAPPDITHWQHFHGFKDGRTATCAGPSADKNGDGIVDLIETKPASGTTMVPFDEAPAKMDVAHGVYPKASADGSYTYHEVVPLKELRAAFAKTFGTRKIDLDRRVIYIHGVPADTKLPSTVASLGPIPANVTLPIACGRIERVRR
jgi:hypothetical protein